jgi:hypothetical protein
MSLICCAVGSKGILKYALESFSKRIGGYMPVQVAARSKAYVYGRSLAAIVGSNLTGIMNVFLMFVLCVVR